MRNLNALGLIAILSIAPLVAACGTDTADAASTETTAVVAADTSSDSTTSGSTTSDSTADAAATTATAAPAAMGNGGPGGSDPSSVTTVAALDALVQSAYGDAGLGLHRGHQPVESVLIEVLGITHDEMHVRMEEQGQNLAAIAEDLGIDPQTLIDALVESWSVAIDNTLAAGAITDDQAAQYLDALTESFTYRVTWNGTDATPTFAGIA